MNVVVLVVALSIKLGCHALGACHKPTGFLHQTSAAAPLAKVRAHAKHAHIRFNNVDARVVEQFADTVKLPRTRTLRVFVDELSSADILICKDFPTEFVQAGLSIQ